MKTFPAASLTRNSSDLYKAATISPVAITKHGKARFVVMSMNQFKTLTKQATSQVAVDVTNMPSDLGALLDQGIKDHFDGP